jgi:PmbA protein
MDYQELTEQLVKKCMNKGADAAEIFLENDRSLSIDIRKGAIETIKESASQGVGFRVFKQGRMAFSHCNDLSDSYLDNAVSRAVEFAESTTADENNVLPKEKGLSEVAGLYDPQISEISMDKKISLAKEAENLALQDFRITKSGGSSYREGEKEIYLANSNGLVKFYKSSNCGFGVSVVAEKGEQRSSGGESCSRRFFADLKPAKEISEKAAKSAYEMLDPQMVKTQRAAVIFDPDVAYAILGGIIGAINGERVLQKASFLADKKGKSIGSPLIHLIDDGIREKGMASQPFDGEGVPTRRQVIVEKGVLQDFMYNTIVAHRAGTQSTGNASRGGFTRLPGIGPHNLYMGAGDRSPEDIIADTSKGIWLKGVTGYGINPVNGNFSGGASGFWIENGKIAFPVKGLTIAGAAFQMLADIDVVGNDLDLNRSLTAPTFRIKEMQIGGE